MRDVSWSSPAGCHPRASNRACFSGCKTLDTASSPVRPPDPEMGIPSATRRSFMSHIGMHPSASKRLVPCEAGLRIGPGTAKTGSERCAASSAVKRAPPRSKDSTIKTTSASAAIIRFRDGNLQRSGCMPSGVSDKITPLSATSSQSLRFDFG